MSDLGVLLVAWRPFLDPIELHEFWFVLLAPMAFLIALSYKAVRVPEMKELPRQVVLMGLQTIAAMVLLGAGFYLLVQFVVPLIAAPR